MYAVLLGLRFLIELLSLAGFAVWGAQATSATWSRVVLAIGTPLLAALLWGSFAAPKAQWRVVGWRLALVELLVFGGASAALVAADHTALGVGLGVLALLDTAALRLRPPSHQA